MPKYNIASIDNKVNKDKPLDAESALKQVAKYIKKNIDPKFPCTDFLEWCDSDAERPFKIHGNTYHWA